MGWLCVIVSLLPLVKRGAWWIRIFDFPRTQILSVAAICLAGLILIKHFNHSISSADGILVFLLGLSMIYQLIMIFPYTPLKAKQVYVSEQNTPEKTLSIVVTNVFQFNRDSQKYLKVLSQYSPEIQIVLEADSWWESQLTSLEEVYPYVVKQPQENTYGMLLYSRLPLDGSEVKFLVDEDVPSIHTRLTLAGGETIQLHCVHPRPPRPVRNQHTTERDAELLLVAKAVRQTSLPSIVAGDYNDVGWSRTTRLFQRISGLLDPRIGRGLYSTFHARYPLYRFPLDHIFHSNDFKLARLARLPSVGSDHFPLLCKLSYEPEARADQEIPSVYEEHHNRAAAKIDRVDQLDEIDLITDTDSSA